MNTMHRIIRVFIVDLVLMCALVVVLRTAIMQCFLQPFSEFSVVCVLCCVSLICLSEVIIIMTPLEFKPSVPTLSDGEITFSFVNAVFLAYPFDHFVIKIIKLVLRLTLIGKLYCLAFRAIGIPYLNYEPINGILYLTNYRLIFCPTEGQAYKSICSIRLSSIIQCESFPVSVFPTIMELRIQTSESRYRFFIRREEKVEKGKKSDCVGRQGDSR